ncbi:transposase [Streptomyces bobili]|nr:transposase [Streptomyces bobili]MCX5521296.1 transposase [Streptomyces bobili]
MFSAVGEFRGRSGQPKGSGWRDFRELVVRAGIRLGGPIVLVWAKVRLHLTAGIREFIAADTTWLTVFHLPAHAPDLNPQDGIWSLAKRGLGTLAQPASPGSSGR